MGIGFCFNSTYLYLEEGLEVKMTKYCRYRMELNFISTYCCSFCWSPDWAIWLNFEEEEFQPRSGIATVLDYSTYCYVRLPYLPCYYSTHCSYHTNSSAHLGFARLRPRISTSCSASTIPWFPLHSSLPLSPSTPCFPRLLQGCLKIPLCRLLLTPCVLPAT